jgi:hypothetical protein
MKVHGIRAKQKRPFRPRTNAHWDIVHGGSIMLRNDSAMNISPALYEEFSRPYDERLLGEFGGGAVHFCGRGEHYIEAMSRMKGLRAVNLSQPELNDMELILRNTVDKGIAVLDLGRGAVERLDLADRALHRLTPTIAVQISLKLPSLFGREAE